MPNCLTKSGEHLNHACANAILLQYSMNEILWIFLYLNICFLFSYVPQREKCDE